MSSKPFSADAGSFDEDLLLMRAVADGDARSRKELVRRLLPRAQRLCQALLRNAADAKDASQTALLQILRSAHTYRGESGIENWADRIVARSALRWIAAERRARQEPLDEEPRGDAGSGAGLPRVLVRECLDRLSEPQRTALLLRAGFEYSIEEIANMTEVSPNTVKDRLTRARQVLRALVRAPGSGQPEAGGELVAPAPPTRPPGR